jgi:REP element-mobilizing transposase RayT
MVYLLTFRCYGTWLHGDERGSVDRFHNQPGEPMLGPSPKLQCHRRNLLKSGVAHLNVDVQVVVDAAIREAAASRTWTIHALNVLSNHVHVVIECDEIVTPERVLSYLKARATHYLRQQDLAEPGERVWEYHGSTRYLKSKAAIEVACEYVLNHQNSEPRTQ